MFPPMKTRLTRMAACRSDLSDNGIDADTLGDRALAAMARRNLEYFQAMLGYDAGLREVIALMARTRGTGGDGRVSRAARLQ